MSPTQKKRFTIITTILLGSGLATFFALKTFQANIEYFLTPQQIMTLTDGVTHRFDVTDCEYNVTIQYTGILPDLFREGQAIVANGKLNTQQVLEASQVLAKHDENYVPKEAAETMMLAQANKCNDTDGAVSY